MEGESSRKKVILWVSAFCSFLIGLDALIVSPLIPQMAHSAGFEPETGGLLVTAYALLYGLSAPVFGPLSDRFGRKRMIALGMVVFALGTACTSLGKSLEALLFFRAFSGLGGAMVMPSVFALIGDTFPLEQRGKAMATVTGAMAGATLLGIPIGSALTQASSWQATFWAAGALAAVIAAWGAAAIPANAGKRGTEAGKISFFTPFRRAFSHRSALLALGCTFLWWAGFQGLFANMGTFYSSTFALSTNSMGLLFSLAGLASLTGNIVGGRLLDRLGFKPVIYAACLLSGVSMTAIPHLTGSLFGVVVAHVVWAFATGLGQASLTAFMSELNPAIRGTILALNSSATYLGMTLSTSLSVLLLHSGGYSFVGLLCAIFVWLVIPILAAALRAASAAAGPANPVIQAKQS